MKTINEKKHNPWKWAFIILVLVILGFSLWITYKVSVPSTSQAKVEQNTTKVNAKDYSTIKTTMNKADFSSAINYLLQKAQKNSGIEYKFLINDSSAILMGTTSVLGKKVTFSANTKPSLNSDGNIVLKINSIGVGSLNAPPAFILNYVKKNYNLKGIVQINSKKKQITLRLDKLTAKNDLKIKAQELDLKNNKIQFDVLIPSNQ